MEMELEKESRAVMNPWQAVEECRTANFGWWGKRLAFLLGGGR